MVGRDVDRLLIVRSPIGSRNLPEAAWIASPDSCVSWSLAQARRIPQMNCLKHRRRAAGERGDPAAEGSGEVRQDPHRLSYRPDLCRGVGDHRFQDGRADESCSPPRLGGSPLHMRRGRRQGRGQRRPARPPGRMHLKRQGWCHRRPRDPANSRHRRPVLTRPLVQLRIAHLADRVEIEVVAGSSSSSSRGSSQPTPEYISRIRRVRDARSWRS